MTPSNLAREAREKRLIITAGSGGVGKTTTAAAIGVRAAMEGRRVVVLTIDPARRLANALGLDALSGTRRRVDPALFERAGLTMRGQLDAMMLDRTATADALVRTFAPDEEAARRIFDNPYYQSFATSLAGTQEYMAIEQVKVLVGEEDYDLVVLDTPPAVHALEFVDAPERLLGALDNRAVDWLYGGPGANPGATSGAGDSEGRRSIGARILGRSGRLVFRTLDKFTGGPFFDDLATFLMAFSALFDRFKASSRAVKALLREPTTSFVLVTSPNPATVHEAQSFRRQLADRGLPFGGFVCNRVHAPRPHIPADAASRARLMVALTRALPDGDDLPQPRMDGLVRAMLRGLDDHNRLATRDTEAVEALSEAGRVVVVPLLPRDVHDLQGLAAVAQHLVGDS